MKRYGLAGEKQVYWYITTTITTAILLKYYLKWKLRRQYRHIFIEQQYHLGLRIDQCATSLNICKRKVAQYITELSAEDDLPIEEKQALLFLIFQEGVAYVNLKRSERIARFMQLEKQLALLKKWLLIARIALPYSEYEQATGEFVRLKQQKRDLTIKSLQIFLLEYANKIFTRKYTQDIELEAFFTEIWQLETLQGFLEEKFSVTTS